MAGTVTDSLKGVESVLRPVIYQMQEDRTDELSDVAEQGRIMLYSIAVAAEELSEYARDILLPYAEKQRKKHQE